MTNKAVDDENADTTGTEMKSTKKPVIKFMLVLVVNNLTNDGVKLKLSYRTEPALYNNHYKLKGIYSKFIQCNF